MLAWIDLEMTGLDPAKNVIVEIATLITNNDLEIIAEGPSLVIQATEDDLAKMDPYVIEMHTRSGLLNEIQNSEVTLEEAGKATLDFLRSHIDKEKTVPLAGNSIGTDRRFLAQWLQDIENFLNEEDWLSDEEEDLGPTKSQKINFGLIHLFKRNDEI